ncbi:alpha/beta fold hydrolase [Acidisphaera sp. L21]|uniref:alpha/beta fold hydrolase n=1 Tax=Acidisphaera sp. L21 TaxID=1641851 RepID=UPI00131DD27F|nr:alpha/beta fold hydrolase [Acidisphaera sp. L21]
MKLRFGLVCAAMFVLAVVGAKAAEPQQHDFIARDFKFHTGQVFPELRLHYTTLGDPAGQPVLIIHGTAGTGTGLLAPTFGGQLFGPGQPLDAAKYFIILPDTIGTGKSSKPSDGLRAKYPDYNYDDMVLAEYRLVTEGLGLHHLRVVMGNSMGGMHAWLWGVTYPGFMDALVPMASQPTEMSARNWMMRRMLVETIRRDPEYKDGNYTSEPASVQFANVFFGIATTGGTLNYQAIGGTRAKADAYVDSQLAAPAPQDANDFLYQWNSSRDFNAAPKLEAIEAAVLAINSADDERNPPDTGLMVQSMKRIKNGRLYLIPASAETRGHGTTGFAKFWSEEFRHFLDTVPPTPQ